MKEGGFNFRAFTFADGPADANLQKVQELCAQYDIELHPVFFSAKSFEEVWNSCFKFDLPFADPSSFAVFSMMKHISQNTDVKVIISGDGADEFLYGYRRQILLHYVGKIPRAILTLTSGVLRFIYRYFLRHTSLVNSKVLLASTMRGLSERLIYFHALNSYELIPFFRNVVDRVSSDVSSDIIDHDSKLYLRDNVLYKSDRILMSFGVEGRSPFCNMGLEGDPRKEISRLRGKRSLRSLLGQFSADASKRKKRGFAVPLIDWLQNKDVNEYRDALVALSPHIKDKSLHNGLINLVHNGSLAEIAPLTAFRILAANKWLVELNTHLRVKRKCDEA